VRETIATWLGRVGYRTGLFGKYLNGYPTYKQNPGAQSGFQEWFAFWQAPSYHVFTLAENGTLTSYQRDTPQYSSTVLMDKTIHFIEETPAGVPIFVFHATYAPHDPAEPPPGAPRRPRSFVPPSFNESDVSDKPAWVRSLPLRDPAAIDELHARRHATVWGFDREVRRLLEALERAGRLDDSIIILLSDNGWSEGEHRWEGKNCPYRECAEIPFVIRMPGIAPRTDSHLVANLDVTATLLDVAGATATAAQDGMSLLPLLQDSSFPWRNALLIETLKPSRFAGPAIWEEVVTNRWMYTEYGTGEIELYDLEVDPYQLLNLATEPSMQATLEMLKDQLAQLRSPWTGAPNLQVSAFKVPRYAASGRSVLVGDTTKNAGPADAPPSSTRFYFSTNPLLDRFDTLMSGMHSVPSLAPAGTDSAVTLVTLPVSSPGKWYVVAEADEPGAIAEAGEDDNTRTGVIYIGPDLIVSALSAPDSSVRGSTIAVTDTTKNAGAATTGKGSTTSYYLSANSKWDAGDTRLAGRAVGVLEPGGTSMGGQTVTIPMGISAGSYFIIARSDDGGAVTEAIETNNTKSKSISIVDTRAARHYRLAPQERSAGDRYENHAAGIGNPHALL
ncbi:MAG: sulfatase-like hydrolase/transferase, partial [Acidobacteria bacterium]|nr:sulfatase-like hydrolase/transferase [Acidobacteriota bacterium]